MTTTPIGFPAQKTQALLADLLRSLKTRADDARVEAVTARRADVPKALDGAVSEVMDIEARLAGIARTNRNIALAENRSDLAQLSLKTLRETADTISSQATVALQNGGRNGLETVSEAARKALATVVASLNVTVGGRGLFAGDAGTATAMAPADRIMTEVEAVIAGAPDTGTLLADLANAFDAPGGLFETQLYGGGTGDAPPIELAPGERVAYQARADEPPLRDLIRSLATIAAAFDPDGPAAALDGERMVEEALGDLRDAIDPLNRIATRIGTGEARIAEVKAEAVATESTLTQRYNDLAGRDQLQAAAELSAVESQLETLFLTTARFSNLSLANFLR